MLFHVLYDIYRHNIREKLSFFDKVKSEKIANWWNALKKVIKNKKFIEHICYDKNAFFKKIKKRKNLEEGYLPKRKKENTWTRLLVRKKKAAFMAARFVIERKEVFLLLVWHQQKRWRF